jgi:hypothetical protein
MSKISGVYSTTFGEKASPLPLYLHESDHGELIGYCGPVTFRGSRRDDEINLTFEAMPLKEFEKAIAPTTQPICDTLNLRLTEGKWSFDGSSGLASQIQLTLDKTGDLPANQSLHQLKNLSHLDILQEVCKIIKQIVNYVLSVLQVEIGDTLKPMSACGFDVQGGGAWLLGRRAPENNFPPMFLHTIWMPYYASDPLCTKNSKNFVFYASLDDYIYLHFSEIISALKTADNFLERIGIHINSFIKELEDLHNSLNKGRYALFFVYSTYSGHFELVFLNEMGITSQGAENYPAIRTLESALRIFFPRVSKFELKACSSWKDDFSGQSGTFPTWLCNPPYWFCYLFGSAGVTFI